MLHSICDGRCYQYNPDYGWLKNHYNGNPDDGVSSVRDGGETIECDGYQASSIPSVRGGVNSTMGWP